MRGLLRSLWDEPRPPRPPSRARRDLALVGVLAAVAVVEAVLRPDLPWRIPTLLLTVGLIALLPLRRTRPLAVVTVTFGLSGLATAVLGGQDTVLYTTACFLLLPYALFRWGSGREIAAGSAVMLAGAVAPVLFGAPADTLGGAAVLSSAAALGAALRYRAGAREREFERARLLERERIARDLHDTVAHHVSAMAIRAQAGLAVARTRPGAAVDALEVIEAEAARALTEMRALVRVLRRDDTDPAARVPQPRVGDLRALAGGSGPAVEVEVDDGLDDLPPEVAAAVHRLAREAVTNARRHARNATRVHVRVTADDTSVHLRVSDDGDPVTRRSTGYGLIGMAERADLLGGTCRAAPEAGRGWTVTADLPRSGAAA
ncbi:sensor histidine kinase [Nocardiopsis sp. CC223A]|uniref:sensor histidine kinase n=1 Tax=Nocardiopsis sp. CC223A TaxID=3044051 RepID=UPI002795A2CB|nr:sensor histidine kinase [Nocardiopsis sp. CC223A]